MVMIKKDKFIKVLNIGVFLLFALLIYKDPFSQRTLIPNFEPYPDTFNYINPALSLITGKGFNISRDGRVIKPNVPPLYSISLLPAFIIKSDSRMSYYSNVILAFIALFLFWSISRKVITNKFTLFFLLILYITNYFIYWVPSIIMAENLTLTFYLAAVYFLLSKTTKVNAFIIAALAVGSYATKYANIPIAVSIIFLSLGKIFFDKLVFAHKIKQMLFFLTSVTICFLLFGIFESVSKGNNIPYQIIEHILRIYNSILHGYVNSEGVVKGGVIYTSSWFGIEYIGKNLPLYIKSILGSPNRFLWDNTPIVPNFIAIGGLIGIITGIFIKKFRFVSICLLLFISSSIIFISTFYSFDARYIYIAIPSLLIGFGLFLNNITEKIGIKKNIIINFIMLIFICIYLISNFTRIKGQISLNLRYAETPWYYIAVLKMNEYFTKDKIVDNKKPVLISALPPFLIDYYSNGNYILLPLSYEQEFRGQEVRQIVWGPNDYSDLPALYTKYLKDGFNLYVSRAGLGNEGYTNRDFNTIVEEFETELVLPGCYDQCNIYTVKLQNK